MHLTSARALATSALLVVTGSVLLAGCSGGSSGTPSVPVVAVSSAAPVPSPSDTASADVLAAYDRFWNARVAAERGNPDPGLFTGIAEGAIVEDSVTVATSYQKLGIGREGAPVITHKTVAIDGDTAIVTACVDHNPWSVPGVPSTPVPVIANGVTLVRTGGAWLATAWTDPSKMAPVPC